MVRDLTAYGRIENQLVRVSPNWTGGIQVGEKDFILAEENYEINFCIHENFDAFFIKCRCILLDTVSAEMFMGIKEATASKEKEFEADQRKLLDENQELLSNNQYLQAENDELKENKQQVQAENQRLKEEQQKLYLENEKLKAHNVELDDRNQSLYSNQRNLKAQIEQLEAAVREYRKLWYVKWKEWIHR